MRGKAACNSKAENTARSGLNAGMEVLLIFSAILPVHNLYAGAMGEFRFKIHSRSRYHPQVVYRSIHRELSCRDRRKSAEKPAGLSGLTIDFSELGLNRN
jgi:hypothetical protein